MNRKAAVCLSALLLVLQTVALPVASALAQAAPMVGCDHGEGVQGWHPENGCSGDPLPGGAGNSGCHHSGPAHRCNCIHTVQPPPGASSPLVVATLRPDTAVITGRLLGAAYPSPQYELLRPPD